MRASDHPCNASRVPELIRYRSATGRAVLTAAVLGSGMATLDGTVVNVALRTIGADLDASLPQLQWVTNAYLLALASLILIGGSLGDRFGRRRIFLLGVAWFALASLLCGLAQSANQLIAARAVQGIGAALLTPGSLAMIQASFHPADRGRAIGAWSGLGGASAAIGPFVGGWLIEYASWRWVFLLNLPLAVVTWAIAIRFVPETHNPDERGRFDLVGAALATVGLAGVTFALIEAGNLPSGVVVVSGTIGLVGLIGFVLVERRTPRPMVPPRLFRSRQFSAANAMTLLVYAALGAVGFFLVLQLQTVAGYRPLRAGVAMLPITVLLLLFASYGGRLGRSVGPRIPMTVGPLTCAVGVLLLVRVGAESSYWSDILPGLAVFGAGLVLLVAPLTSTVLGAAPDRNAGIASGINNAVARAGSLVAVSALPAVVGLSGADYTSRVSFDRGYEHAMWICAVLLALGGVASWLLIRNPARITVAGQVVGHAVAGEDDQA